MSWSYKCQFSIYLMTSPCLLFLSLSAISAWTISKRKYYAFINWRQSTGSFVHSYIPDIITSSCIMHWVTNMTYNKLRDVQRGWIYKDWQGERARERTKAYFTLSWTSFVVAEVRTLTSFRWFPVGEARNLSAVSRRSMVWTISLTEVSL